MNYQELLKSIDSYPDEAVSLLDFKAAVKDIAQIAYRAGLQDAASAVGVKDTIDIIKLDRDLSAEDYVAKYPFVNEYETDRHLLDRAIAIIERGEND